MNDATGDHLRGLLGTGDNTLVLLAPGATGDSLDRLGVPAGARRTPLSGRPAPGRHRDTVVLCVPDLLGLRRAVTGARGFGTANRVALCFDRCPERLPTVSPRPEWPPLERLVADRAGGVVLLEFAAPVALRWVVLELARAAAPGGSLATGWPSLGAARDQPRLWPPADPGATIAPVARLVASAGDLPADLTLLEGEQPSGLDAPSTSHPVLGRPPAVAVRPRPLTWGELSRLTAGEAADVLRRRGPEQLGAVDERIVNPIGFDRDAVGEPVAMRATGSGWTIGAPGGSVVEIDASRGLSDGDLPPLRRCPAVALDWSGGAGPEDYCRVVAHLATAGIPLVGGPCPPWARHLLGEQVTARLAADADVADRLSREESSIRLRRAALRTFATGPWRRSLGRTHHLQTVPEPSVSVLLVTRREEMLPFALRQVARQRDSPFELVVATHGFELRRETLDAFARASDAHVVSFGVARSTPFGRVLDEAVRHASGQLLVKMDDDDWYGPDFLGDLLLARSYSGAEVVGCFPEFTFLERLWLTTRRPAPSETYSRGVAGGTMLVDRAALESVGGFRHLAKYVDAGLLRAVAAAGGRIYQMHGLDYVLRRRSEGHTWDPGLNYFLAAGRADEQWRGFRPSSLLEPAAVDSPVRPTNVLGSR